MSALATWLAAVHAVAPGLVAPEEAVAAGRPAPASAAEIDAAIAGDERARAIRARLSTAERSRVALVTDAMRRELTSAGGA